MDNKNLQRNQILILLALLVIISVANYINYYAPKRVKVMEDLSTLSDAEKQHYIQENKYVKISDDATFDENGRLIAEDESKDNIESKQNYLNFAATQDGKIARWNKKTIKYFYVDSTNYYAKTIENAINTYNKLFKGLFYFEYTKNRDNADVEIFVKPQFTKFEKSNEAFRVGLTNIYLNENNNNIEKAKITLIYKHPIDKNKKNISKEDMYKVVLHELGHAVGISGHSDNENDIMYPTLSKADEKLSQRDRVTIKLLYSNDSKILTRQLKNVKRTKINEAKKYVKGANDLSETKALVNLAQTYFENGQKEKALETYKKAINKDKNNYIIYKSMGECYYFSKKYEQALKFLLNSYSLSNGTQDTGEILNMIGVTYARLNDFENAYKYLNMAYDKDSENYEILQNLLASCLKTNRKKEALLLINTYKKNGHSINSDDFMKKAYSWAKS